MGGVAKGKLRLPNQQTLIERLIEECRAVAQTQERLVLVGDGSEYSGLGLPGLADEPQGIGPLGGLAALLREGTRASNAFVIALACDLPFLSRSLIQRLLEAPAEVLALAARQEDFWQPLAARYSVEILPTLEALIGQGERSFQSLFRELGPRAAKLCLAPEELAQLRDWDTPEDMHAT
jgi:molybdopterin-guanine dinucleotide biosynthesis protein A